jgi:hypothetical protein
MSPSDAIRQYASSILIYSAAVLRSKSNGHRQLDRQLVTGRRDYAIFVHPALIWETNASRPSATRAVARMNITGMRSSPITVVPDDQPG